MRVPSITEIKKDAREWGDDFFSESNMKWFDSTVGSDVYQGPGGTFFVTRERPPRGGYVYTVRRVDYKNREIVTAGGHDNFGRYKDWSPAYRAAKRCSQRGVKEGLKDEFSRQTKTPSNGTGCLLEGHQG